mmetsp:Transcript_43742/g.126365  ORF Transcript_43742/g.126365 Transcript_43742/m.126365 type:complete len:308 (+) Transcript_43742:591-1514(+)
MLQHLALRCSGHRLPHAVGVGSTTLLKYLGLGWPSRRHPEEREERPRVAAPHVHRSACWRPAGRPPQTQPDGSRSRVSLVNRARSAGGALRGETHQECHLSLPRSPGTALLRLRGEDKAVLQQQGGVALVRAVRLQHLPMRGRSPIITAHDKASVASLTGAGKRVVHRRAPPASMVQKVGPWNEATLRAPINLKGISATGDSTTGPEILLPRCRQVRCTTLQKGKLQAKRVPFCLYHFLKPRTAEEAVQLVLRRPEAGQVAQVSAQCLVVGPECRHGTGGARGMGGGRGTAANGVASGTSRASSLRS